MKLYQLEEKISEPFVEKIKQIMPYKYNGEDYSKAILIIFCFVLMNIIYSANSFTHKKRYKAIEREEYYKWRERFIKTFPKEKLSELDRKFEELHSTKRNRTELLKEFAILKNQLDNMGQTLSFLAIDVIDSTGMKKNEDRHLIAYAFECYNQLVFECLKENGVVKYATTPDGIMSCFKTTDDAVKAAIDIIKGLKTFNETKNQLKRRFEVRCGINTGFVYMDEDTPLEQVSDLTIDIAGHMQKHARPNAINIAKSAIEPLLNREGFSMTSNVIDEQVVYEWKE